MKNSVTSGKFLLICGTILAVLSCGVFSEEEVVAMHEAWYLFNPVSVIHFNHLTKRSWLLQLSILQASRFMISNRLIGSKIHGQLVSLLISSLMHETRYSEDVEYMAYY